MDYVFGRYRLSTRKLQLFHENEAQALEPQVFSLLRLLIENHDRVVSKDEIHSVIWKDRIVSDAALSSRVKVARAAIGDDGATQSLIRTAHGKGFQFVGDLEAVDTTAANTPSKPRITGRPSLAIMPLSALTSTPEQAAFGEGLLNDIATGLGRLRALYVVESPAEFGVGRAARELGVRYALVTRLRFAGAQFRLNAALVDAQTMEEVWAERFGGETSDTFAAQDKVCTAILGALVPGVLMVEINRAVRSVEQEGGAYEEVLRAIPLCWISARAENAKALNHLEMALSFDPDYALAHALASWCHSQRVTYVWAEDPELARTKALDHARTALRLAPQDSLVLTFVASAETSFGDIAAAEHHITKAIEIDPNSVWGIGRLGYVRLFQGLAEQAIEAFQRAIDLSPHDPMRHNLYFGLGAGYFAQQDPHVALRWLEQALIDNPDMLWAYRLLAACRALTGDATGASQAVQVVRSYAPEATAESLAKAVPIQDPDFRARLLAAYKLAGF